MKDIVELDPQIYKKINDLGKLYLLIIKHGFDSHSLSMTKTDSPKDEEYIFHLNFMKQIDCVEVEVIIEDDSITDNDICDFLEKAESFLIITLHSSGMASTTIH